MGDPKKQKKKYAKPSHPWQAERLAKESIVFKKFGLVKKREIWKMESILKGAKTQAKHLLALKTVQAKKEEKDLLEKLVKLGLVHKDAKIEDILDIDIEKLMARRLQSYIVQIGLARTIKQARQMIVHGHILVDGKKVDSPSYLVTIKDENKISFVKNSPFISASHPERQARTKEEEAKEKRELGSRIIKKKEVEVVA